MLKQKKRLERLEVRVSITILTKNQLFKMTFKVFSYKKK